MVSQLKVLVVEDEHITALDIRRMLERAGYLVTALASTGQRAIEKAAETKPDVVLMDINLKGTMDGISAAAKIREQRDLPVIYLTAFSDEITLERAKQTSPYGYLLKPINERELHATIKTSLHRHKTEVELRQRNRELALLNKIISASVTGTEPETFLEVTCIELAHAFGLPFVVVLMFNKEKNAAIIVAQNNRIEYPTLMNRSFPVRSDSLMQSIINSKVSLAVPDVQNESKLTSARNLLNQYNIAALLIHPLTAENGTIGFIALGSAKVHHFSADQINLGQTVADQISGALSRMRLQKQRDQLSAAFEQTAEMVMVTDLQGAILYVNPAFERVTGYNQAEVLGVNPRILKSEKQSTAIFQEMWQTIVRGHVWKGRIINKKKDGSLFTEDSTITPVRNERGEIVNFVAVKRDITRELQLEEQYRQAQKMEAVGLLAGGIAHDFNNLLTAINGFAELLQMQLPPDSDEQELARKIGDGGQRAAELVRQLLTFSRKQIIEPKIMNLNDIFEKFEDFLGRIIGEHIQLKTTFASDLWFIKADPGQMEQIFLNLAVNARDAMPYGGQLAIETANVFLAANDFTQRLDLEAGEFVVLTVSDSGVGMSDGVKKRIFEPFYTTKEVGKGTGLGLATVYGIVKQNDGAISVSSESGHGTIFKIYFPRSNEVTIPKPRQQQNVDTTRGNETILLVEDNHVVRKFIAEVLRRQGYNVLEAVDGNTAKELADKLVGSLDLLVTDIIMQGINGKELADLLKVNQPSLKVLYMSGYSDDVIAKHGVLEANIAFIQKPFGATTIARMVRQVLAANLHNQDHSDAK